ncbi:Yip1 domain-containing protein [Leptolyngbyaceae cyanobacterium JSC-12]|nr:Yip1 domain-containing protein [Leptolyngbyaceae cyanobacterium JSC-12]
MADASSVMSVWDLVTGTIALKPQAYKSIEHMPNGDQIAVWIVFFAGLSEAIAQGIVLFINRVKPFRFFISIGIAAVLFVVGFFFWAGSTWFIVKLVVRDPVPLGQLMRTLALSYSPRLLSFFIALPYFGVPLSVILSIWSFLAFLVGITSTLNIGTWQAFWCGVIGWLVFQILENTIGRPVAAVGRWLKNTAAGVPLVTDLKELEQLVERGRQP